MYMYIAFSKRLTESPFFFCFVFRVVCLTGSGGGAEEGGHQEADADRHETLHGTSTEDQPSSWFVLGGELPWGELTHL